MAFRASVDEGASQIEGAIARDGDHVHRLKRPPSVPAVCALRAVSCPVRGGFV
jgi:hypothetical protein